jgi:hypothetical protein
MRLLRSFLAVVITCALFGAGLYALHDPAKAQELMGSSVTLGGRKVQCNNAPILVDYDLPSEGAADDGSVFLNPDILNGQPETVRIFVFKHECGHLTVGGSELAADCFAVHQGVREEWLDRKGLDQVCASLDGEPESDTHPSGERRCRNLNKCYVEALAERRNPVTAAVVLTPDKSSLPKKTLANKLTTAAKAIVAKPAAAPFTPAKPPSALEPKPALPTLEAWSVHVTEETAAAAHRAVWAWRCTEPSRVSDNGGDPIARLIIEDAKTAVDCRHLHN